MNHPPLTLLQCYILDFSLAIQAVVAFTGS